jgi:hypothetical protein
MNIENIAALVKQLDAIGLESATSALVKRISFLPEKFVLERTLNKGTDTISLQLFFQKLESGFEYVLRYYDVTLTGETQMQDGAVNDMSILDLEKEMKGIDWKTAFELDENKPIVLDDKKTWEREAQVQKVIIHLLSLEGTEEGKQVAARLKHKYWSNLTHLHLTVNLATIRDKSEVSQRFYPQNAQNLISIDEAYRFLLNRKLEKEMLANRKRSGEAGRSNEAPTDEALSGSGLLRKRRAGRPRTGNKANRSK